MMMNGYKTVVYCRSFPFFFPSLFFCLLLRECKWQMGDCFLKGKRWQVIDFPSSVHSIRLYGFMKLTHVVVLCKMRLIVLIFKNYGPESKNITSDWSISNCWHHFLRSNHPHL